MTGDEHYAEAERLLSVALSPSRERESTAVIVAYAQVHATLALAVSMSDVAHVAVDTYNFTTRDDRRE